jgi:hypothetical protein
LGANEVSAEEEQVIDFHAEEVAAEKARNMLRIRGAGSVMEARLLGVTQQFIGSPATEENHAKLVFQLQDVLLQLGAHNALVEVSKDMKQVNLTLRSYGEAYE